MLCLLLGTHVYALNPSYDDAQKAYAQGDFQTAYILFESLHAQSPENAELNFYVGRCALELHRYDEAQAAFDRVLMLNPQHMRTHLELARLYYEQNAFKLAQNELNAVLKTELPNDVRDSATAFKRKIDDSLSPHRFSGAFVLGGGYDNNVNNDIGNHEFVLSSLNLPLSGKDKEKDGYAFSTLILNHHYAFDEATEWSLEHRFILYDKLYSKSTQNDLVLLSFSSAPIWSRQENKIAFPITLERVYIDQKGYLYHAGISIKESYLIDETSVVEGGYGFKRSYYHEATLDANVHQFFTHYRHDIANGFFLDLQTSYILNKELQSVRTDVEYHEFKYGLELSQAISKELKGTVGYTKTNARYHDVDTLFLNKRKDDTLQYEFSLTYAMQGHLALGANLSYSDHQSNQEPYDYDKINAQAYLTWTF